MGYVHNETMVIFDEQLQDSNQQERFKSSKNCQKYSCQSFILNLFQAPLTLKSIYKNSKFCKKNHY